MYLAIYIMGMLVFTSGFYFIKKSETAWNGICHIFVAYIVWMMVQSMACMVNFFLHYPVIAWQYGILGLVIGSCWWIRILTGKQRQKYYYSWADVFMVGLLLIFVIAWGCYQFGSEIDSFNFASMADSTHHFTFAKKLTTSSFMKSGFYLGQCFAAVNTGAWMDALTGIVSKYDYYKIFVFCELAVFFLNGMIFWTAIRHFLKNPFVIVVGMVLTLLYLFGYPCNSLVYGTSYLSTGIMLAIIIYYFASLITCNDIKLFWGVVLLVLAEFGLLHSYQLFVPIFLCGTLLYLFYWWRSKQIKMTIKRFWLISAVWGGLAVLGICILFRYYPGLQNESNLSWEIYGHVYADYLFLFPFLLLLFRRCWKKKEIGLEETLLFLNLCFIVSMLIGVIVGRVSSYYFYKTYYIFWGLAFLCVVKYFSTLKKANREFPAAVLICWILLFAISVTGMDQELYRKNTNLNKSNEICLFPIYVANQSLTKVTDDKQGLTDLIDEAVRLQREGAGRIPYVSVHELKHNWLTLEDWHMHVRYIQRYHVLTCYSTEWWNYMDETLTTEQLKEGGFQYVLLTCAYQETSCIDEMLQDMAPYDVVMKNSYGCLVAVHPYSFQALQN